MDEWKRAIVRVWHGRPHKGGYYRGTAFLIAPGTFITAKHVVESIPPEEVYLRGPAWNDDGSYVIHPPILHDSIDVGILKVKKISTSANAIPLPPPQKGDLKPGQNVLIAGYGTTDSSIETLTLEITSYESVYDLDVAHTYITRGMSGGPVLLDNYLAGIIRARHRDQNKSYILRLNSFRDFIDKHLTKAARSKGKLFGVPELPPNFLPRQDVIDRLKKKLTYPQIGPIAVTSAHKIGLHGMGGIGKTVLAAIICRDHEIQNKFYDGIFWITLGENPDLVSRQILLAESLSNQREHFSDTFSGKARLYELLEDLSCLIILDDVWEMKHIATFNVLGPRAQLLITTRNSNLLTGVAGEIFDLELLSHQQARELLVAWSNQPILPYQADDIVDECGRLPLAIAMVGAMLRERDTREDWEDVLELLREAELEGIEQAFPDYKHATLFRALHASVNQLDIEIKDRYLDFAIFPDDTPIPTAVFQTLWSFEHLKRGKINRLLHKLKDLSLLHRDETGMVTIHDLQRDYVRSQIGDNLPKLHLKLLNAYRRLLENQTPKNTKELCQWAEGPNDGYFFEQLCHHLKEAGDIEGLKGLLISHQWLWAKLMFCGINSLIRDFTYVQDSPHINAIQHALQISARILKKEPSQMPEQLTGRLLSHPSKRVQKFISKLKAKSCWLHPIRTSVAPASGALLKTFSEKSVVDYLTPLTKDGTKVISHSWGETVTVDIWDFHTFKKLTSLPLPQCDVNAVAMSVDGKLAAIATGTLDKAVRIWDLTMGKLIHVLSHKGSVNSVLITSDGKFVVSGSDDNTIKVWSTASGSEVCTLRGHTHAINQIVLTPDDSMVISASNDKTLKIWEINSGKELYTFSGHHAGIEAVAVTPCSSLAISASRDHSLKVWDLKLGKMIHPLCCHSAPVNVICITPDGSLVISASLDGILKVWNVNTGEEQHTLSGHSDAVNSIAVTPDGTRAISASGDQTLKVWDLAVGEELHTFYGHTESVKSVAVTPDGSQSVSASEDGTIKVWNLLVKEFAGVWRPHSKPITSVIITCNNTKVISGSDDKKIKVWDLVTGEKLYTIHNNPARVNDIFTPLKCDYMVSAGKDKRLRIWDLETGKAIQTLEGYCYNLNRIFSSKNRTRIVSVSSLGSIVVWDVESGKMLFKSDYKESYFRRYWDHTTLDLKQYISRTDEKFFVWNLKYDKIFFSIPRIHPTEEHLRDDDFDSLSVSVDGRRAVYSSYDSQKEIPRYKIRVWDLRKGELIKSYNLNEISEKNSSKIITGIEAMSLDGTQLVVNSSGKTRLWDFTTNIQLPGVFQYYSDMNSENWENSYVFTSEGYCLVLAYWEGVLKLWVPINIFSSINYFYDYPFDYPKGRYSKALITSDRNQAIISIPESEVKVFDLKSGEENFTIPVSSHSINSIACTPDGSLMVSISEDNKIVVWNLENGIEVAHFMSDEKLSSCNISHDGRHIVAGDYLGGLYILRLEDGNCYPNEASLFHPKRLPYD